MDERHYKDPGSEKLDAFTVKVGYPDKWRDYSALVIDPRQSYWDNIKRAIVNEQKYNLAQWGNRSTATAGT